MPHSEDFGFDDDFGFDEDDTAFIAAATQAEASQHGPNFEASPRPTKRRKLNGGATQVAGVSSEELVSSGTDDDGHSPPTQSSHFPKDAGHTGANGGTREGEPETDEEDYRDLETIPKQSKHKIHIPKNGGQLPNMIFTQTQIGLDSSPGRLRGPVWKRPPRQPPPPVPNTAPSVGGAQAEKRNGTVNRAKSNNFFIVGRQALPTTSTTRVDLSEDERLAETLQAEEDALFHHTALNKSKLSSLEEPLFDMSRELADLPSDAFSSSSPEKSPARVIIEISSQPMASQLRPQGLRAPQTGLKQMTIFGQPATQDMSASQAAKKKHAWLLKARDEAPTHHELDKKSMETWVYPTNLGTTRDYQFNIVSRSLFNNTLVALPTGLGKTFIAATVMLNYYRWTKSAQIVFMAPTKPLISQQMDACYHIVGIPRRDTVLMTGETTPAIRADQWLEKRVFFMTPQTVINDMKTGICDPKKIILIVVDEAHKATGGYAYTEVVAFMRRFNSSFRVMALTATPGSTVEAVQAVIDNLDIARVELRTEQSLDIRQYTHEKQTETEVFEYTDEQALIMELVAKAIKPVLEKLCTQNAYWSRDPMQLSAYGLTNARQKWATSDAGRKAPQPVKGMVNAIFTVLASLAHSIGLLKNHGIGPFYSGVAEFQRNVDSGQSKGKTAQGLVQSDHWTKMSNTIRTWTNNPDFIGHPKLQYLREVVLNHFLDAGEGRQGPDVPPAATRVMVFASYRDSTEEICRVLKRNEPMIRPHVFVGQAGSKGSEGMNQKKQNEVVQAFKAGKYNTLVATSIGEEGLDIGDVDLIVCYDASSSPIRMLQRIGRTGRKRIGRVVLLLMKGKEETDYAKAQDNYAYIQKTIADDSKYTYRDENSKRILPKDVQPIVNKCVVEIPIENSQPVDLNEKKNPGRGKGKAKRPPKKFHMPDNVITGFVKASKLGSDDDDDAGEPARGRNPSAKTKQPISKAKARQLSPEPEAAQLPFLEDVLLSAAQHKELERKYARTADDDDADLVIRAPDCGRFPEVLKQLGSTMYVRHGEAAKSVARAMQALHAVDDEKVRRMKELASRNDLDISGATVGRLMSPVEDDAAFDVDLPSGPIPVSKPRKPRRQSGKNPPVKDNTSINSIAKNGRARVAPKRDKRGPKGRAASYGSAAMEGDDSTPESTPADMRIGTQGIDLGSKDTSGEDDDEEPDSDMEAFIAKSDEVVETLSSSLPQTMDRSSQATLRGRRKGLKLRSRALGDRSQAVVISSDEASDGGTDGQESVSSKVEEPVHLALQGNARRRKRLTVADSDSE